MIRLRAGTAASSHSFHATGSSKDSRGGRRSSKTPTWCAKHSGLERVSRIAYGFRESSSEKSGSSTPSRSSLASRSTSDLTVERSSSRQSETTEKDSSSTKQIDREAREYPDSMSFRLGLPFRWTPIPEGRSSGSSRHKKERGSHDLGPELRLNKHNISEGYTPPLPPWKYEFPSFFGESKTRKFLAKVCTDMSDVRQRKSQFTNEFLHILRNRCKPVKSSQDTWGKDWIHKYVESIRTQGLDESQVNNAPIRIEDRASIIDAYMAKASSHGDVKSMLQCIPVYNPRKMMLHIFEGGCAPSDSHDALTITNVSEIRGNGILWGFEKIVAEMVLIPSCS
eukprot:gb/GECG01013883.1/.p1 GENE.gb/GECG01013883.1/~~gb/GECG01013883.1/.p1  ORF type:complete len:338 (+),score=31.45 gb/GECG01013883.1/:1-1014(+)